jgi:transcriptional regulator with XRE-family HTH domain
MNNNQEFRTKFAKWLENEMRAQGIDSKTLADKTRFDYTYIRRLLKDRTPSLKAAKKIGEALGKPKEALIGAGLDQNKEDQLQNKRKPKELFPIYVYLNWLEKVGLFDRGNKEIFIAVIEGFYSWHLENSQIKKSFIDEFTKRFAAEIYAIRTFPEKYPSYDPLTSRIADFVLKQPSPTIYSSTFSELDKDLEIRIPLFYTRIIRKTHLKNGIELLCPFVFLPFRLLRPFFDPGINLADIEINYAEAEANRKEVINFFKKKHKLFTDLSQNEKDAIIMMAKYSVEYLWDLLNIGYEPLKTSEDFYDAKVIYNLSREIYVFSTTSGLFVPEEYYGASLPNHLKIGSQEIKKILKESENIRRKNPVRSVYFEDGIMHGLKHGCTINYQFDYEKTREMAVAGYKSAGLDEYDEIAIETLSKYLMANNLEISTGAFEKDTNLTYDWRNWLTIVSEKYTVLSARQPDTRALAHGLIIESDLFNKMLPSDTEQNTICKVADYLYTTGKINVLKGKDGFKDIKIAKKEAKKLINELLC